MPCQLLHKPSSAESPSPSRQTRSSSYLRLVRKGCTSADQPARLASSLQRSENADCKENWGDFAGVAGSVSPARGESTGESMGESTSPSGDVEDHVTHPGLFPQAAAALVHCQVQPLGRVMWGKHSMLCLSTQLLSLSGGFKPFLLAFMLSMSGFFFNLMSFQCLCSLSALHTHTSVYCSSSSKQRMYSNISWEDWE